MFIYLWTWRRGRTWELHTSISTSTAWRWNASVTFQASASLHGLEVISVSGTAGLNGLRSRDMRQTSKDRNWMTGWIPRSLKITNPWSLMRMDFGCPWIPWRIFFCRNLRQIMVMVRSGGGKRSGTVGLIWQKREAVWPWRNWYGWNGRQDGWSNGHFFCVKAISGWKRPQMAMPTALKDFQCRNAEKPDLGVREWKVMGIPLRRTELSTPRCLGFCRAIQIQKRVKLWSLESQHQSQKLWLEAEALASLAVARYACPNCSASFAKWSACYRHISHVSQGVMFADLQELQARCKEKAEKLSAFICRARRSGVKFRGYLGVTRYCTFLVKLHGPILGNENSCAAEVLICLISANCATSTGSVTTSILQQKKRETGAFPLACHSYDGNRVAKWKSWDKWLAHTFALHYGWSQPVSATSHHEKHPKHPILARSRCRSKSLHDLASILGDQAGQAIPWCWTRLGMGNIGGDSFQESEESGFFSNYSRFHYHNLNGQIILNPTGSPNAVLSCDVLRHARQSWILRGNIDWSRQPLKAAAASRIFVQKEETEFRSLRSSVGSPIV